MFLYALLLMFVTAETGSMASALEAITVALGVVLTHVQAARLLVGGGDERDAS